MGGAARVGMPRDREGGRWGREARVGRAALLIVVALALAWPAEAVAQRRADPDTSGIATRTHAVRGLTWGAVGGGSLGGLALGVLAWGLCDKADCDGSFGEGFLVGMVAGAAAGGVTGLVVGSAFPADGRSPRGWGLGAYGGGRGAWGATFEGTGLQAGARLVGPTTRRSWFGAEVAYLGSARRSSSTLVRTGRGESEGQDLLTVQEEWRLSRVGIVALRSLGPAPPGGAWLLAGAGAYPVAETLTWGRTSDGALVSRSTHGTLEVLPGVGVGVGGRLLRPDGWGVEAGARLDLVGGLAGSELTSLLHLTVGLGRWRLAGER